MTAKQLQALLAEDISIEDLILAKNDLKVLDTGFQEIGVESPESVDITPVSSSPIFSGISPE